MRPHGRASVSQSNPRAFGICDRCGFLYNHHELQWQYDYRGAALVNIRILVCDSCLDVPQNQLRNIVIPADPTPIMNARIQDYIIAENDQRLTSQTVYRPISATGDGTTATLTLQVPLVFAAVPVGSTIVVAGMQPQGYNGTFVVTASSNTGAYTVSYACHERSPMAVSGYVATNVDPVTGLTILGGDVRITQSDDTRVTQMTGEPPFGTNQQPGTDPNAPGNDDPGLPYGFNEVPKTGPLDG